MGVETLTLGMIMQGLLLAAGTMQATQEAGLDLPAPSDLLGKGPQQRGPYETAKVEGRQEAEQVARATEKRQEQAAQEIVRKHAGDESPAAAQQETKIRGLEIKRQAERDLAKAQERAAQSRAATGRGPGPLIRQDADTTGLPGSRGTSRGFLQRIAGTAGQQAARAGTALAVGGLTDRGSRTPRLPQLPTPASDTAARRADAMRVRRTRTVFSSPLGLSSRPNVARRSLLGQ